MIGYVVVAALAIGVLYLVLSPLRKGERRDLPERALAVQDAEGRKRAALTALVDLETEREIGKLDAPEFETLRSEYEAEAVAALHELDALEGAEPQDDDAVEAEIARIRANLRS
ncbi:MAG: hypothetical protein QOH90_87 [Actinomycetota bacterium]|nr:hypothetical protein [Actinomycetota bacterium]